jgi:hypothetical protein
MLFTSVSKNGYNTTSKLGVPSRINKTQFHVAYSYRPRIYFPYYYYSVLLL